MAIYQLDEDIHGHGILSLSEGATLERFDLRKLSDAFAANESLKSTWHPIRVTPEFEDVRQVLGDLMNFNCASPPQLLSRRAMDILRPLTGDAAEFLPMECSAGEYYALHVLRTIDAIDRERSNIKRYKSEIFNVRSIVLREEALRNAVIFKLPEQALRHTIFVTDAFRECVASARLTGFLFRPFEESLKYMRLMR